MYICICHQITEKDLTKAIDNGHTTLKSVQQSTKLGSSCGQCTAFADFHIKKYHNQTAHSIPIQPIPIATV